MLLPTQPKYIRRIALSATAIPFHQEQHTDMYSVKAFIIIDSHYEYLCLLVCSNMIRQAPYTAQTLTIDLDARWHKRSGSCRNDDVASGHSLLRSTRLAILDLLRGLILKKNATRERGEEN